MNGTQLRGLVARLRQTARLQEAGAPTDADLVRRWVAGADQAAFELLLWRHGPMVLGVCRRLLRHAQDVEDAFQATFLALVRKAGSIGKGQVVGSWLHTVAFRVALQARARRARRAESGPVGLDRLPAAPGPPPLAWELRAVLDEEVSRLPERYRVPFVLCYFEGKTNVEAARELGRPVGTVVSRLARARERLRGRLARRGLAPSAGLLAAVLAPEALATVPPTLVGSTLKAVTAVAAGQAALGAVLAPAAALTEGALRAMFVMKLKAGAGVLLALLVVGAVVGTLEWTVSGGAASPPAAERALAQGHPVVGDPNKVPAQKPGGPAQFKPDSFDPFRPVAGKPGGKGGVTAETAREEVELRQAQVEVKRAHLAAAKAAVGPAKARFARLSALSGAGAVAAEEVDQARAALATAEAAVLIAEAEVREAQVRLRQAERRAGPRPPAAEKAWPSPEQRLTELEKKLDELRRDMEALRRDLTRSPRPPARP